MTSFLPMVKHSRDLHAHKIKRIITVTRAILGAMFCTKPKNRYIQRHKNHPGLYEQIESTKEVKLLGFFAC